MRGACPPPPPLEEEENREEHGVWFSQHSVGEGRRSTEPSGLQCVDEGEGSVSQEAQFVAL